jgi:hypothetical protein
MTASERFEVAMLGRVESRILSLEQARLRKTNNSYSDRLTVSQTTTDFPSVTKASIWRDRTRPRLDCINYLHSMNILLA